MLYYEAAALKPLHGDHPANLNEDDEKRTPRTGTISHEGRREGLPLRSLVSLPPGPLFLISVPVVKSP